MLVYLCFYKKNLVFVKDMWYFFGTFYFLKRNHGDYVGNNQKDI